MNIAILIMLAFLIVLALMLLRRVDVILHLSVREWTGQNYHPWYYRLGEFLFNDDPIFRP